MSGVVSVLDAYCRWSGMAGLPSEERLDVELQWRERRQGVGDQEQALESMFTDLDEAQDTIDNRADAILKLTTFLGAGLTALGKADGRLGIRVLSLIVVCASGCGLGLALQASSHSAHRKTLLLRPKKGDLIQSCTEFKQKQRLLAGATLFTLAAVLFGLAAVVSSIV
jgi:hypothetical protein